MFDILNILVRPVDDELDVLHPQLPGGFTDYNTLCAPYVPNVRDVLEGRQYRFKVQYNDTFFHFYHGCLMVQAVHEGLLRALPPFGKTTHGVPYLHALPEHQLHWFDDFLSLPKGVLLFYFTLMKEVFGGQPLRFLKEDPRSGQTAWVDVPHRLQPILSEVEWQVA